MKSVLSILEILLTQQSRGDLYIKKIDLPHTPDHVDLIDHSALKSLGISFSDLINGNSRSPIWDLDEIPLIKSELKNTTPVFNNSFLPTPDINNIYDDDIKAIIKRFLEYTYSKLALSNNILDVLDVFQQITELIGKIDFLFAILFHVIYKDKLWIKYGYKSLNSFLQDLPSVHRFSRQTFINYALAGKVILYFGAYSGIDSILGLEFKLTPNIFFRNYSKIKLLYRILFIWKLDITSEIMVNFRDMTYRDFNIFINEYKILNKDKIINIRKYYQKSFLYKQHNEFIKILNCRPFKISNLNESDLEIYNLIKLGYIVECINSNNSVFVDSVIKYLQDKDNNVNYISSENTGSLSDIFSENHPETPLCDIDLAEFYPDSLNLTVEDIICINYFLKPDELRKAIVDKIKNKTELTLVLASLIYNIEHNIKLHPSISDYFKNHKIERKSTLEVDFAVIVLDLKLSRYKWLKRIGNSIPYLKQLTCAVNFSGKILDKLSYLKTAFYNHEGNQSIITKAFFMLPAKRFRMFAYDKNDDLTKEIINRDDYQKAKPILKKIKKAKICSSPITVITLKSKKQEELLNEINEIIINKDVYQMVKNPEINWESEFNAEIKKYKIRQSIHKKNENNNLGLAGLFIEEKEYLEEIKSMNGNIV